MQITTIGLDSAKNVFQIHVIDAAEKVIVRKRLRRGQVLRGSGAMLGRLGGLCHVRCGKRRRSSQISGS